MGEDTSLAAFLDDGETPETDETGDTDDDNAGDSEGGADHAAVEPARTTYAFTPDRAACGECGTETARRWTQDGTLVCASCKDW